MKKEVNHPPPINNYLSFRDDAARVVKEGAQYYRYIFNEYKAEYDHLINSGLYDALISEGVIIPHEEVNSEPLPSKNIDHSFSNIYKKILPKQIGFQSYPFEWSFSQWLKAISTYLIINRLALKHGMILKDATPYNFYFESGKAIMFDTSSFTFFKNGDPWFAYRQFCSEFLSPIFLMHYNGNRWSRLTRTHISGLPLNFVSKQLPLRSWFNITCLVHIHLHSRYSNDEIIRNENDKIEGKKKGFTQEKIEVLLSSLQRQVRRFSESRDQNTYWQNYYEKDIESEDYIEHKISLIKNWIDNIRPKSVLDIGANTGKFSLLASEFCEQVISLESDEASADSISRAVELNKLNNISTAITDLAEPTPNMGLMGNEINSIFTRAKSEMVLGLAISHHFYFKNKMNFGQIAEMFGVFCEKYLIIEFISINDNKVKLLMKGNTIRFKDYNEESFLQSLTPYFKLEESVKLNGSFRKLFLLVRIN